MGRFFNPYDILVAVGKHVQGWPSAMSELRKSNFTCEFSRRTAPPDGPVQDILFDGTITNATVIRQTSKLDKENMEFVRLSFRTEDVEFRRTCHIEVDTNGNAEIVFTRSSSSTDKRYECKLKFVE